MKLAILTALVALVATTATASAAAPSTREERALVSICGADLTADSGAARPFATATAQRRAKALVADAVALYPTDPVRALVLVDQALVSDPASPEARVAKARLIARQGRHDEVVALLAGDTDRYGAEGYALLAAALEAGGRWACADHVRLAARARVAVPGGLVARR
ncbi:MAG: hypothetical protein H6745_25850 [Deltaproteobacteria bacterium]|nr:hypothetical protein [Deltaproteobacteria bacterium]